MLAVVAVAAVVPALRNSGAPSDPAALAAAPLPASPGPGAGSPSGSRTTAAAVPGMGRLAAEATAAGRTRPHPGTTAPAPATTNPAAPVPGATSARKGASIWKSAGMAAALRDSGVSWFYDWGPDDKGVTVPGVEFVPMIWGSADTDAATIARAKASGSTLLGFNEPDLAGQAQLSVDTALSLWPTLQATGMRLGAPAVAYGGDTAGGWLDRFMTGAAAKGYRVDFIPLHWYGGDFRAGPATDQLKAYVAAVYARYHKPIWITEYALMNFGGGAKYPTAGVESAFVASSTAMLRGLSYVERYAWFSLSTPDEGGDGTGLYRPDGTRTPAGDTYRSAT
ncbi:MAG TPA: glycoside hydrolase family protein [Mycobacteriales bacterium]|nr:glycoside hydrolase family protein [Mycobacteriales bacterium]